MRWHVLIPTLLLAAAGCTGAAEPGAPVEQDLARPEALIHTDNPMEARGVWIGPANCTGPWTAALGDAVPLVRTATWPGPYEHMTAFRMELRDGQRVDEEAAASACAGWRLRIHTHLNDGSGTLQWYLQINGTGLPMGLIFPVLENATYHYDLEVTDGVAVRSVEGEYPNAQVRKTFGYCDPHTPACWTPDAQATQTIRGNMTRFCAPQLDPLTGVNEVAEPDPCSTLHPFQVTHEHHKAIRVRMDYAYDVADLDYRVWAPDGTLAGSRESLGDTTRLFGPRTEQDLVIDDPRLVGQTGDWILEVWPRLAYRAEYGFTVTFHTQPLDG